MSTKSLEGVRSLPTAVAMVPAFDSGDVSLLEMVTYETATQSMPTDS